MALWSTLVENSINKGKRGLQVFEDICEHFLKLDLAKTYSIMNYIWNKDLTFQLLAYLHMILKMSLI